MRANAGITIACLSVLSAVFCAGVGLQAQTPAPAAQPPVAIGGQDSANELSVAVGKSVLVDFDHPIQRVAVGLPEVAEVTALTASEIMLNGKTAGQTSLIVWEKGGDRQFFNVTVRRNQYESVDRLDAIRRELNLELPGQPIKVTSENGSIFLRGRVRDLASSERAVQIATTGLAPIQSADNSAKNIAGVGGSGGGSGSSGKVINLLFVDVPAAPKQILLKVHFASVDRNKSQKLGMNFTNLGLGNVVGAVTTGQFGSPSILAGPPVTATLPQGNLLALSPGLLPIGIDITAVEAKGVAEVLAEPNLIAANGQQASFLAGGEYPFPVVQGGSGGSGSTISIEWKEYGVRLNFIPTITPRGTIRLQVAPEVSALDFADAVLVAGYEVPALTVRRVQTEAELADGQSFVIGGLLDNRETDAFQKIPFLGDIPVLGKFFQSMEKQKNNTELIVIVTPEIVDPIAAGAALPSLKYPTKFLPPNTGIPMSHPDGKADGSTPPTQPESIPVERLIESQKPETPLQVEKAK